MDARTMDKSRLNSVKGHSSPRSLMFYFTGSELEMPLAQARNVKTRYDTECLALGTRGI